MLHSQRGLENRRNTVMTDTMLKRTNAQIMNRMRPVGSRGGVRRLTCMRRCIVRTSRSRKTQAYQAKYLSKEAKVSTRRPGASQYSLCGRLILESGVLAIVRGAKNPTEATNTIRPAYSVKNCGFVSQPLGTPEGPK